MAEVWENLKSIRLKLQDPGMVIALNHVADHSALIAITAIPRQTAYRCDDTGSWYTYDEGELVWKVTDLKISDADLNTLIDTYGVTKAIVKAIPQIISGLYNQLQLVRMSSGTESSEFLSLSAAVAFYKSLKDMYDEDVQEAAVTTTGRFVRTCRPTIGGVREW